MSEKIKLIKSSVQSIMFDNYSLDLSDEPINESDILIHKGEKEILVGYLIHDTDCENPLQDDGVGKIYRFDKNRDEEAIRLYKDQIKSNPHANKLAIPLNKFEHGSEHWFPASEGIPAYDPGGWDTSKGAGIWVPDDECVTTIQSKAILSLLPKTNIAYCTKRNEDGTVDSENLNIITITFPDGSKKGGYKSFLSAARAAAKKLGVKLTEHILWKSELSLALAHAKTACELYSDWCNGESYSIIIELFALDDDTLTTASGTQFHTEDTESYHGLVGFDWARKLLVEQFESYKKKVK